MLRQFAALNWLVHLRKLKLKKNWLLQSPKPPKTKYKRWNLISRLEESTSNSISVPKTPKQSRYSCSKNGGKRKISSKNSETKRSNFYGWANSASFDPSCSTYICFDSDNHKKQTLLGQTCGRLDEQHQEMIILHKHKQNIKEISFPLPRPTNPPPPTPQPPSPQLSPIY